MHFEATETFIRLYKKLPQEIKERTHPSLGHKKMAGQESIYEVRVTKNYRLTYQKVGDIAYLRKIGTHDLLRNP